MANKKQQPKVVVLPAKAKAKPKPVRKPTALAIQKQTTPEAMIMQAVTQGVSIKTLERLMVIRREVKKEQAKEAFDTAIANFQSECPVIKKNKSVYNKKEKGGALRYSYAPLDSIITQVNPFMKKHGLSHTADAEIIEKTSSSWVKATVKITHILGHSEPSSFEVPIDNDAYMSNPQKFASALTFAKRYAFLNALGILTGDDDNDAQPVDPVKPNVKTAKVSNQEKFKTAIQVIDACKNPKTLKRYYADISKKGPKVYNKEQMSDLMEALIKKGDELK